MAVVKTFTKTVEREVTTVVKEEVSTYTIEGITQDEMDYLQVLLGSACGRNTATKIYASIKNANVSKYEMFSDGDRVGNWKVHKNATIHFDPREDK